MLQKIMAHASTDLLNRRNKDVNGQNIIQKIQSETDENISKEILSSVEMQTLIHTSSLAKNANMTSLSDLDTVVSKGSYSTNPIFLTEVMKVIR